MASKTWSFRDVGAVGSWWTLKIDETRVFLLVRYQSFYSGNAVDVYLRKPQAGDALFRLSISDRDWVSMLERGILRETEGPVVATANGSGSYEDDR